MSCHRPHPITGEWNGLVYADDPDAVLHEACERCDEIADRPMNLDPERAAQLWQTMVAVERAPAFTSSGYRNPTEGRACRALYAVAVFVERTQPLLNPWVWPWAVRRPGETAWVPLMAVPARDDSKDQR